VSERLNDSESRKRRIAQVGGGRGTRRLYACVPLPHEATGPAMKRHRAAGAGALTVLLGLLASCATAPPPRPIPPAVPVEAADASWPRREVLALAMQAYRCGEHEGRFHRPLLTIIDYSLPSSEPRLWVIDVQRQQVLHHVLVAHGEGSGATVPVSFSNEIGSHQSSLGLFRTEEVYTGHFGYSLRLSGLEPGINDKARERAIVVHGMSDVSASFAAQWGTIARSWGCLALPEDAAPRIIDSIADGSAIFVYYPDAQWLQGSHYLHCDVQLAGAAGGN
jgi:L,D-transpeptidase-like protein